VTGVIQTSELARHRTRRSPWKRTRPWLLVYCGVICAVAVGAFSERAATPIMSSRSNDIAASIAVLDRGGPPLLASDVPYRSGIAVSHLRPVGVTDDQGIYLYLPLLSKLTGERDPAVLMKLLFMISFAVLVFVLPLIFYELFGSILVAVAAPLLALWKFSFTVTLDLYWVLAWSMLLGIPSLVLAYQWWGTHRKRSAALLVALMIAASYSTSIRIHSGLPLLVGALGIVLLTGASWWRRPRSLLRFWRSPGWWMRPAVAASVVLAYLSVATIGFAGVRAYRNHVIHQPRFGSNWPTQHPFWHNAYIGLGYLPNKYGIEWSDSVSADAVQRERPGTGFLTKEYEATLRGLYADIARDDPGFVLRNFWTKARVLTADAVSRFWPVLVLLPVALLTGRWRRSMRTALLVSIPAALFGALSPVLTIPEISYQLAWLGTFGALFLLCLGWLWVAAQQAVRELPPELEPLRRRPDPDALDALVSRLRRTPAAWAGGVGILLVVFLVALARPAPVPGSGSLYASQQSADFVAPARFNRPSLRSWRFAGSLPKGWRTVAPAYLQADNGESPVLGLYTRSEMNTGEDELSGPPVELRKGTYDLLTSGRAIAGGFRLIVRADDGTEIASSAHSNQQAEFLTKAMQLRFKVTRATRVHVTVSNWSAFPNSSAWVLWKMKLQPVKP
jgi:hypothetical protein